MREYRSRVSRLQELRERRAYECRLTPDRALESLEEADEFLRERGLLTRTPDCALPSLFEACHEEPYKPGAGGFAEWPRTKYRWSFDLAQRAGVYALKIHRGKTVYLSEETAVLADPILRSELDRLEQADPEWARLLRHLGDAGPSLAEDLLVELELKPKELKLLRAPLERCGAIVGRYEVTADETELTRWDILYPKPSAGGGLDELLVAGVRAAVVAPEREVGRWFSWSWLDPGGAVGRLLDQGRLERPEPGWVALPASS